MAAEEEEKRRAEEEEQRLRKAAELERKRKEEEAARLEKIERETRERIEREIREKLAIETKKNKVAQRELRVRKTVAELNHQREGGNRRTSTEAGLHRDISVLSDESPTNDEGEDIEESTLEEMKDHVRHLSATDDISTLTSNWGSGVDDFDF